MKKALFLDEIYFIKQNYDKLNYQQILDHINSHRNSSNQINYSLLRHRFKDLGLSRYSVQHWSKAQINFLIKNFRTIGNKELAMILSSDKFRGNKIFTRRQIDRKMTLLNLKRTPEEYTAIVRRNISLGYTKVNQKGNSIKTPLPEGMVRIQRLGKNTPYNFVKVNGHFVMAGRYFYQQNFGIIPKGKILFRIDMDSLNDSFDNLRIRKPGPSSQEEVKTAYELLGKRIAELKCKCRGTISSEVRIEMRRLEKLHRITKRKMK